MVIEKRLTKELLYTKTCPEDIFRHYFGEFKIGKAYNSVLRSDKNPSCSFYYPKTGGEIRLIDYGTGQSWTALAFIQELYQISFGKALQKVWDELGCNDIKQAKSVKESLRELKRDTIIQIIPKAYTEADLAFWGSYGIEEEDILKLFNLLSVKKLWINKKPVYIKKDELAFGQYFPHTGHMKIYFPTRPKREKWKCNVSNDTDVIGYHQMKIKETKPELLVLTSSLKEVMLLYSYGIKSIAIHGENSHFNKDFIRHLRKYTGKLVSLYDNDKAGEMAAKKLEEEYQVEPVIYPDYLKFKDISDCYKEQGNGAIDLFIKEQIKDKHELYSNRLV